MLVLVRWLSNWNQLQIDSKLVNYQLRFFFNSRFYRTAFDSGNAVTPVLQGRNLWSASQRDFVDLDAATSNPAKLKIPYWQLWPLANIKQNHSENGDTTQMSYGSLDIFVKNALKSADGVSSSVDIAVYVAFNDPEFRGVLDREVDLPAPQMDVIGDIVKTAESALKLVDPVLNMDKPPAAQNKIFVQPLASQSLAYMDDDVERLQALRMSPLAQTPDCGMSNMNLFENQLRTWSLLTKFEWAGGDASGHLLYSIPAEPVLPLPNYEVTQVSNRTARHLPILAILSSMRAYWSGDLELKFEFVSTMFHTGAIQVCCVPGVLDDPTLERAKNSHSSIFKLKDTKEFIFVVPFFSMMPTWPVRRANRFHPGAPSQVFVYVLNKLTTTNQIPSTIDVNVYIRAGENFSLTTPAPTQFALPWYQLYLPAGDTHIAYVDYSWGQMFTSGSRWTPRTGSGSSLCCFYNQTTDWFTQFVNLQFGRVYAVPVRTTAWSPGNWFYLPYEDTDRTIKDVTHICRLYQYSAYPVAICFNSLASARSYLADRNVDHGIVETAQGGWAQYSADGTNWANISAAQLARVPFTEIAATARSDEFVFLPQMQTEDDIAPVVLVETPATTTSSGKAVFGENVLDIKSYGRRFFHYGCLGDVRPSSGVCLGNTIPIAKIACHPIRLLDLRSTTSYTPSSKSRDNRMREGTLGLLLSPFAGYRGGLRYKFVIASGMNVPDAIYTVVHKYDEPLDVQHGVIQNITGVAVDSDTYIDTTYASALQCTRINPVLDVEVPFYKPGPWASLSFPPVADAFVSNYYHGNGNLYLYINGTLDTNITYDIDVFYSLADDFEVSCWQGYPPVFSLTDMNPEPQMWRSPVLVESLLEAEPNGFLSDIIRLPSCMTKAAETITETVKPVGDSVLEVLSSVKNAMKNFDPLKGLESLLNSCKGFGFSLISQILHIIASPSWKTIAVSIVSLLMIMGGTYTLVFNSSEIWQGIKDLYNFVFSEPALPNMSGDEHQQPHETLSKALSMVWSICCNALAVSCKRIPGQSLLTGLFISSGTMFRNHIFGVKFFQDFLTLMSRCLSWINKETAVPSSFFNLAKDDKQLLDWFIACHVILAPENGQDLESNQQWQEKVFTAYAAGQLFYLNSLTSTLTPALKSAISSTFSKLQTKVREMIDRRAFLPLRCCPVVFWLSGKGGLGKSTYFQKFIRNNATAMGIDPHIYELSAGNKYYDLLSHQQVILLDDFLNVKGGDLEADTLAQFQKLVGEAPISLPRSAVEDKKHSDNPVILGVTSNQKNFNDVNCIRDKDAFLRRIHIHLEFLETAKDYQPSKSSPLTFDASIRKIVVRVLGDEMPVEFVDDAQCDAYLVQTFLRFRNKFMENYKRAMDELITAIEQRAQTSKSFDEYCTAIRESLDLKSENSSFAADIAEKVKRAFGPRPSQPEQPTEETPAPSCEPQGPEDLDQQPQTFEEVRQMVLDLGFEIKPDGDVCASSDLYDKHKILFKHYFALLKNHRRIAAQDDPEAPWISATLYDSTHMDVALPTWLDATTRLGQQEKFVAYLATLGSSSLLCSHSLVLLDYCEYVSFSQEFCAWAKGIATAWFRENPARPSDRILCGSSTFPISGVLWNTKYNTSIDALPCRNMSGDQHSWCRLSIPKVASTLYSKFCKTNEFRRLVTEHGLAATWEPHRVDKHMPIHYWSTYVQPLLEKLQFEIKESISFTKRAEFEDLLASDFPRDLVEIDGVCHMVTPEDVLCQEVLREKRTRVIPGVHCITKTELLESPQTVRTTVGYAASPTLKFLLKLGGFIALILAISKFVAFLVTAMTTWSFISDLACPNISASGDTVMNRPRASAHVKAARLLGGIGQGPSEVLGDTFKRTKMLFFAK